MITILAVIPNPTDATSFYRGVGPLGSLKNTCEDGIHINYSMDTNWAVLKQSNVVFLQRPCMPNHLTVVKMAKRQNRPVWVDYDDLLFQVPDDNPAYFLYMRPEIKKSIIEIIQLADVVTVSTNKLKKAFQLKKGTLNQNIHVVPNAFDDDMFRGKPEPKPHSLACWRGSNTHDADMWTYAENIVMASKEFKTWTWNFIGWNPWFITQQMPDGKAIVSDQVDIMEYWDLMRKINPAILFVPLSNSVFNECKSNIAWIEATYAGACVLAPFWEEWKRPGITSYEDSMSFAEGLEALIKMHPDDRASLNAMSWDYIQKNLLLSQVNRKREQILRALVGDGEFPAGGAPIEEEEGMALE